MRILTKIFVICSFLSIVDIFGQVRINEVMFDPGGNGLTDEFIEILNISHCDPYDLRKWTVSDSEGIDSLTDCGHGLVLQPGQYGVIFNQNYQVGSGIYNSLIPDEAIVMKIKDSSLGSRGLSNSQPEEIILFDADQIVIDTYRYSTGNSSGFSDERINPLKNEWRNSCCYNGTPGYRNSVYSEALVERAELIIDPEVYSVTEKDVTSVISITCRLPMITSHVALKVFNLKGVCVRVLEAGQRKGSTIHYSWDGRTFDNRYVQTGMYIVYLYACSGSTGMSAQARSVVIIHTR